MEKTIDRTCYRRPKEENKIEKTKRKQITIFYNEVIVMLGIVLIVLIVKIYNLEYFESLRMWYKNELEKGIKFEEIEEYFYMICGNIFVSNNRKSNEAIISSPYLINDTSMVNESEIKNKIKENESLDTVVFLKEKYKLIKPVEGVVTSGFGIRESNSEVVSGNHKGIDIAAINGTDIVAAHDGKVIYASELGSYGLCVVIESENLKTIYAHCSDIFTKKGDVIKQGEKIAEVGMTGNATGNHLHFEIRYNEDFLNPEEIIQW